MSEANKYGQGDNHTMEARIIRNPAFEVAAAESDEQTRRDNMRSVWTRFPRAEAVNFPTGAALVFGIIDKARVRNAEISDLHPTESEAWADARRRLEPKPDAAGEAKAECLNCGYTYGQNPDCYVCMASRSSAPRNSALEDAIAALTARAEKAERERDEAVLLARSMSHEMLFMGCCDPMCSDADHRRRGEIIERANL